MGVEIKNFNEKEYDDNFIKKLYDNKFHNNHWEIFRPRNKNAAKIIYDIYKPKSVIDFGCSIGTYLEIFLENNCEIRGYEYCYEECLPVIKKIKNLENFISFGDVTKPLEINKKYDLSMSIEVAEHIPTSKSKFLVENLCNASKKNILFTAAKPDQGGTGHINCQEKEFWILLFSEQGWQIDYENLNLIKEKMIPVYENNGINDFPIVWNFVYENLMCFKKC